MNVKDPQKQLAADARKELSRMKARMRKLNVAEIETMAHWLAYSNFGFGGDDFEIKGDQITIEMRHGTEECSLKDFGSIDVVFESAYQNDAETEEQVRGFNREVETFRKTLKRMSLEKISTTWGDFAPVMLYLAKNGGQG